MNKDFTIIPGTGTAIYWPDIDPKFKFVTVDYNGQVDAWEKKPEAIPNQMFWATGGNGITLFEKLNDIQFENWQELIFERPE